MENSEDSVPYADEGIPDEGMMVMMADELHNAADDAAFLEAMRNQLGSPDIRVLIGISDSTFTEGLEFVELIDTFRCQFPHPHLQIVATERAMKFIYRHSVRDVIYTDEDFAAVSNIFCRNLPEELSQWATRFCIFANPATVVQLATGDSKDLLTLTTDHYRGRQDPRGRIYLFPVMTDWQWDNIRMRQHVQRLKDWGFRVRSRPLQPSMTKLQLVGLAHRVWFG